MSIPATSGDASTDPTASSAGNKGRIVIRAGSAGGPYP